MDGAGAESDVRLCFGSSKIQGGVTFFGVPSSISLDLNSSEASPSAIPTKESVSIDPDFRLRWGTLPSLHPIELPNPLGLSPNHA